jgi:hypothetical protein
MRALGYLYDYFDKTKMLFDKTRIQLWQCGESIMEKSNGLLTFYENLATQFDAKT